MSSFPARQIALLIGLVTGLTLGLAYTWVVNPVELVNTYPALLRTDYRWDWVRLAALSYAADGNLERARARLDGLKHEDIAGAMQALIEEYAAAGRPASTLRRLTTLADALDVYTPAMLVYLQTPGPSPPAPVRTPTPKPTRTPTPLATPSLVTPNPEPTPTFTPTPHTDSSPPTPTSELTATLPTATPTPSLLARLHLAQQEQVCEPGQTPHIEIVVRDEGGDGVAGVEVWLMWSDGADRAVTGLKPQNGAGYADFNAQPGVTYTLGTSELGMPLVTGLRIEPCPTEGGEEPLMGSWRIVLEPRPLETE